MTSEAARGAAGRGGGGGGGAERCYMPTMSHASNHTTRTPCLGPPISPQAPRRNTLVGGAWLGEHLQRHMQLVHRSIVVLVGVGGWGWGSGWGSG